MNNMYTKSNWADRLYQYPLQGALFVLDVHWVDFNIYSCLFNDL